MNKDVTQKVNELRTMQAQVQYLERQLDSINATINELDLARVAIEEIKKSKEDVLVPVGAGISVRMRVTDASKALVQVGGGVVVEKDIEKIVEDTTKRREEFLKLAEKTQAELERVAEVLGAKEEEVRELAGKQRE